MGYQSWVPQLDKSSKCNQKGPKWSHYCWQPPPNKAECATNFAFEGIFIDKLDDIGHKIQDDQYSCCQRIFAQNIEEVVFNIECILDVQVAFEIGTDG